MGSFLDNFQDIRTRDGGTMDQYINRDPDTGEIELNEEGMKGAKRRRKLKANQKRALRNVWETTSAMFGLGNCKNSSCKHALMKIRELGNAFPWLGNR